jgi:DNA modification methylase
MTVRILIGDVREQLRTLADNSVHCCVTSPPYWNLRDYGVEGQIGLEATPAEFIATMVDVFEEVRRVLRPDATCWINMGDSYATSATSPHQSRAHLSGGDDLNPTFRPCVPLGLKAKDLCMMPHRLAIALQDAGWWVRQDICWSKPNPMPESVRDRCTKSHEYIFLLAKSAQYYYDAEAIKEPVVGDPDAPRNRFDTKDYEVPGQKPQKRLARGVGFGHGTDAEERQRKRVTAPAKDAGRDDQGLRTAARFGGGAGFRDDPDSRPSTRNKRSVWTMATHSFAEAHFATFPPELPEICIKAGTSEAGHCPECGNRWVRVIERTPMVIAKTDRNDDRGTRTGTSGTMVSPASSATTGWAPTCACSCDPVPDVVLDPFFGAGTSGLVADRLQRDCIGIELNLAYAEIARKRIQGDAPLFAEVASAAPEPMKQEQASFAEVP